MDDLIIAERQEAFKTIENLAQAVLDFKMDVEKIFANINNHVKKLGEVWEGPGYSNLLNIVSEQIKIGNKSLNNANNLNASLVERAKEVKEFIEMLRDLG